MKEMIVIRTNYHATKDGVTEYSFEFAIPGKFQQTNIGASQEELKQPLHDAIMRMLTLLGVPETVERKPEPPQPVFNDEHGNPIPISGFAAKTKASFNAQVIRDGKVVED